MNDLLLEVIDLQIEFSGDDGIVRAVDGVSFSVRRGQVLGVLGESGCGKSVTGFSLLHLITPPGRISHGSIRYYIKPDTPIEITSLSPHGKEIQRLRGAEIGMIFQEPATSLDPLFSVGAQLTEAIMQHQTISKKAARQQAQQLLSQVGLPEPEALLERYPHQLSGGQRQRVMIAIALSCNPKLLVADEPTTALDVTTEAQILELLKELQHNLGMAMIFISHDLGVISEVADEVVVMYLGKIVERAAAHDLFEKPQHPYTIALMNSVPKLGEARKARLEAIEGMVPTPQQRPIGCAFHPRCPKMMPGHCDERVPELLTVGNSQVSCLLYEDRHG